MDAARRIMIAVARADVALTTAWYYGKVALCALLIGAALWMVARHREREG